MKAKLIGLLVLIYFLFTATTCEDEFYYPTLKVKLVGIEVVNLDNTGLNPVIGGDSIKKEAYVIGVRFRIVMKDNPNDTIYTSESSYYSPIEEQKIYCNTDLNEEVLAGDEVSNFFVTSSLGDYDRLLILRKVPKAGVHSFKVRYELDSAEVVEANTIPIKLF